MRCSYISHVVIQKQFFPLGDRLQCKNTQIVADCHIVLISCRRRRYVVVVVVVMKGSRIVR
eukprot:Nitzschia sp. Nitz4//scaffold110_size71422//39688//39867//NITZ4_005873-RA/size71422-exonerate_est2genome-gene-0.1-mRNA-1//1//CDS//3329533086//1122//frame0